MVPLAMLIQFSIFRKLFISITVQLSSSAMNRSNSQDAKLWRMLQIFAAIDLTRKYEIRRFWFISEFENESLLLRRESRHPIRSLFCLN
jgi:hypothetical protein